MNLEPDDDLTLYPWTKSVGTEGVTIVEGPVKLVPIALRKSVQSKGNPEVTIRFGNRQSRLHHLRTRIHDLDVLNGSCGASCVFHGHVFIHVQLTLTVLKMITLASPIDKIRLTLT